MATKEKLATIFTNCLNILRSEGLTGEKALRNLSYILILKLIEPLIGNKIDIDNYEYDFSDIVDEQVEYVKTRLLHVVRFSNLIKEPQANLLHIIKYLWSNILSEHQSTKNIFLKNKNFDIKKYITFRKLFDNISTINLDDCDHDILGNAYEEIIQHIMIGKVLGQFFTPSSVKKLMVKLIDPQILEDGKIETCCDPTMGTGGFLTTYLNYLNNISKEKNIKLDWNYVTKHGLYGKEIEPDTYQLAISNLLISSGYMFENLDCGDSICDPIDKKFDCILANPPFGIKGLKYDSFNYSIKDEYLPIETNNAVSLFLQAIIYMLKINGRCAVVLPSGQDLFSKNKTLVMIRQYLLKTCDLKEVIYLPSNTFTYTTIETCIFYFVKKEEGNSVLQKTYRNKKPVYSFNKKYSTERVYFYSYNCELNNKELLVKVDIEQIISNDCSLIVKDYIKVNNLSLRKNIETKKIKELVTFLPKSKRKAADGNVNGVYPFFTSSNIVKFCDKADYNTECIIIGTGGKANVKYSCNFSCSTDNFIIKTNEKILNAKYFYCYLSNNIEILEQGFNGIGIKHISKEYIQNIEMPVPSLNIQLKIIKEYEKKQEHIKTLEAKIKEIEKEIENYNQDTKKYIETMIYNDHQQIEEEIIEVEDILEDENIDSQYTLEYLKTLSVIKLKIIARQKNITPISKLKKQELIDAILS